MSFNPTKTKYMVVSNSHQQRYPALNLDGDLLERVSTYPQLGIHLHDQMNWAEHINTQVTKANKKISLIWKLSGTIPRFAVENIYTGYIRPQLEYGCVIYANCTKEKSERLESVQRNAAIACTRAYNRTPTQRLMEELGWPTLETRRSYFALLQIYKMKKGLTPTYLQSILPPRQGEYGHYPTRRCEDFVPPMTRTAKYHKSFIPATVRKWNDLDENLKIKPTVESFKSALKKKMLIKKPKHLSYGKDKWAITHTRMRLGMSPLNQHLHSIHVVPTDRCPHCGEVETTTHLLLRCDKYAASRDVMMGVIGQTVDRLGIDRLNYIEMNILLLNGHIRLTLKENLHLFENVEIYLKNTRRF